MGSALSPAPTESSEVVGLATAMVILAITFGSLIAMGLPILTALIGLMTALGTIGLLSHVITIPTVGPTLATMIGLGVGIDYSLFLITKYRDLHDGGWTAARRSRERSRPPVARSCSRVRRS